MSAYLSVNLNIGLFVFIFVRICPNVCLNCSVCLSASCLSGHGDMYSSSIIDDSCLDYHADEKSFKSDVSNSGGQFQFDLDSVV